MKSSHRSTLLNPVKNYSLPRLHKLNCFAGTTDSATYLFKTTHDCPFGHRPSEAIACKNTEICRMPLRVHDQTSMAIERQASQQSAPGNDTGRLCVSVSYQVPNTRLHRAAERGPDKTSLLILRHLRLPCESIDLCTPTKDIYISRDSRSQTSVQSLRYKSKRDSKKLPYGQWKIFR